jgi:hypothetical protein
VQTYSFAYDMAGLAVAPTPPDPFVAGGGTDFVAIKLSPVPEPSSVALLFTVFLMLAASFHWRLRRRTQ